MAINPMKLMQLKTLWDGFASRHPKFPQFLEAVSRHGIPEGTVIEVQISMPNGDSLTTNLKVTAEDLESLKNTQDLS